MAITAPSGMALAVVWVLASAAMLIIPLPTWLLDLLITTNLALSGAILVVALQAPSVLALGTLPQLLVLTTLYRLALNVSTVRLILLQADAGRVVRAFGAFVVRGDYLVGLAIFVVLVLVQYLVIARGAQRVAEVAARFRLDALPGTQLSIEGELRAGSIDKIGARAQRQALLWEAQLYGALDGAMRFVKGDAIAAIVILMLSLCGGFAVGVLERGLSLGEALRRYTLLTIGDGLVSQIPALLLATAAGVVVTRVAAAEGDESPGRALLSPLLEQPRALLGIGLFLGLLALMPGLPFAPFLLVSLVFLVTSWWAWRQPHAVGLPPDRIWPDSPPELELVLGQALVPMRQPIEAAVERTIERLVNALGVPLPLVRVVQCRAADTALPGPGWLLRRRGMRWGMGQAPALPEGPAAIATAVEQTLRLRVSELLEIDDTQRLLDGLAARKPALVREVVARRMDVVTLTEVLQRLLVEGLSVTSLDEILTALARLGPNESARDLGEVVERLRSELRRSITQQVAPDGRVKALVLEPMLEGAIADAIRHGEDGAMLALGPELADDVLDALGHALKMVAPLTPVLVTPAALRRHVWRLVQAEHPELRVVSYHELEPGVVVEPVGRVALDGSVTTPLEPA